MIGQPLCSFTQETPLNTGAEQLAATTRRRLAMVHTHRTLTHQEELNRTDRTPPGEEMRDIRAPTAREGRGRIMGKEDKQEDESV